MKLKPFVYFVVMVGVVGMIVWSLTREKENSEGEVSQGPETQRQTALMFEYHDMAQRVTSAPAGVDILTRSDLQGTGWVEAATRRRSGGWDVSIDMDEPGTVADGTEAQVDVRPRGAQGKLPEKGQKVSWNGKVKHWKLAPSGKLVVELELGYMTILEEE